MITEFEIRQVYRKEVSFNSKEFIDYANTFDLIVIGGGNYFELWSLDSSTGTSIDISIDTLKLINCPILFYSLGLDLGQGFSNHNLKKFYSLIDYLNLNNTKYFLSLRNDGSINNFKKIFKNNFNSPTSIPDSGFFYFDHKHKIDNQQFQIIVNIAGDMQEIRFNNVNSKNNIQINDFYITFSQLLMKFYNFLNKKVTFNFVTHIYKDYVPITQVINLLPDKIARENVRISSYGPSNKEFKNIYKLYKNADFILANRFHSNILAIALQKNFVALVNYPQIYNLMSELGLSNYVYINEYDYDKKIFKLFKNQLDNKVFFTKHLRKINNSLLNESKEGYQKINFWLNNIFIE